MPTNIYEFGVIALFFGLAWAAFEFAKVVLNKKGNGNSLEDVTKLLSILTERTREHSAMLETISTNTDRLCIQHNAKDVNGMPLWYFPDSTKQQVDALHTTLGLVSNQLGLMEEYCATCSKKTGAEHHMCIVAQALASFKDK